MVGCPLLSWKKNLKMCPELVDHYIQRMAGSSAACGWSNNFQFGSPRLNDSKKSLSRAVKWRCRAVSILSCTAYNSSRLTVSKVIPENSCENVLSSGLQLGASTSLIGRG